MTSDEANSLLNALAVCLLRAHRANVTLLLPHVLERITPWWPCEHFGIRVSELLSALATNPDYARSFLFRRGWGQPDGPLAQAGQ